MTHGSRIFQLSAFPTCISKQAILLNRKLLGNAKVDSVQLKTGLENVFEY